MMRRVLLAVLLGASLCAPSGDRMDSIPGYPSTYKTNIYSGYLDLKQPKRAAHYVFVESVRGAGSSDPVTLWLNGGPGCSSLLGFLQQIGPYFLEDGKNYTAGEMLAENPYSWHKVSHLLFLESPAGVGFSYNLDDKFEYDDAQTANDSLNAVLDFFLVKFPEYQRNNFWMAGESYAGKYIPDLAMRLDQYNLDATIPIKFKGMLVGNGLMTYDTLPDSQVKYMMDRSFVDPELYTYFPACSRDPESAACRFFNIRFAEDIDELNIYNVYGYCYYNDIVRMSTSLTSQAARLLDIINRAPSRSKAQAGFNGAPCAYFKGDYNYFNSHRSQYHAMWANMTWNGPCANNITYNPDYQGSMASYGYLLGRQFSVNYQIHLYNGNWDFVIPYHDTITNIRRLGLIESYLYTPWIIDHDYSGLQHAGFTQIYSGIIFTTVKGASHEVPQTKRRAALTLFNDTLQGHTELHNKLDQLNIFVPRFSKPKPIIEA